jgi:hypothetical protein
MTAADLSLLRHLAEKMMGRKPFPVAPYSSRLDWPAPANEYFLVPLVNQSGGIVFGYAHGKAQYWNPLDDANDCRDLSDKLDKPMIIYRDPKNSNGLWQVRIGWYGDVVHGPTEERAFCLAVARMTGWQEPEESGQ